MSVLKGDFIGFTYNNVHSSQLGIIRTSNGSRYTENLLPSFSDKTVGVDGMDGAYYFGTEFKPKEHPIAIAYDSLSEEQFRRLRNFFSEEKLLPLIFDETPYKVYKAKLSSTPQFTYVCFDTEDGERVYKGEATLNFISYVSWAESRFKYLEDYTFTNIPEWDVLTENKDEWYLSSGMVYNTPRIIVAGGDPIKPYDNFYMTDTLSKEKSGYDVDFTGLACHFINPGDRETDFKLRWAISNPIGSYVISLNDSMKMVLNLEKLYSTPDKEIDYYLEYNSKNNLIEGIDVNGNKTGSVYNYLITAGDFFKLPVTTAANKLSIVGDVPIEKVSIEYNYIYY